MLHLLNNCTASEQSPDTYANAEFALKKHRYASGSLVSGSGPGGCAFSYLEIGPGPTASGDGADNPTDTDQKPAGGFLIGHFKRCTGHSPAGTQVYDRDR
jgi:hypothetical protein